MSIASSPWVTAADPRAIPPIATLAGGIVAFNEEQTVVPAIRSLLEQDLPVGVRWETIWVVASGCTDRTTEAVARLAKTEPRVKLVVEPERLGKSRALLSVFERARGDALVLLNSDAIAKPGAVAALLETADGATPPFGVMGRPLLPPGGGGTLRRMLALLWTMHHELHAELQRDGGGTHLSDELLLVSVPVPPVLHQGVINDGAYLGAWLALHGGARRYAVDAAVTIDLPKTLRDHLRQRRRIHVGDRQIAGSLKITPSTFASLALRSPRRALAVVRRSLRDGPHTLRDLLLLTGGEVVASVMAGWDRLVPVTDHVLWERIARAAPPPTLPPRSELADDAGTTNVPRPLFDRRLQALLEVAGQYSTGIPLEELTYLLPPEAPSRSEDLQQWLGRRPDLVRLEGDRAFSPQSRAERLRERQARAVRYTAAARELVDRHLAPTRPWLHCVGVTGSTAYGEPEAGDDLDFFVVTRTGALWVFLTYTYLAVRLRFRPSPADDRPVPCFNLVLDERQARKEFSRRRGFLFAREALLTRMLQGEGYYRGLLGLAPWLGEEIPRLYRERAPEELPRDLPAAPWPVRILNGALYPWVATYLQCVGLWRNARFRGEGRTSAMFRTRTEPGHLDYASERFDRLTETMAPADSMASPVVGMDAPSHLPTAR